MSELASESVESTKDELYFLESVTFSVSFLSLLTDLSRSDNGLRWRIVFFEYRNIVSAIVLSSLPKNIFLRVVLRSLRDPSLWPTLQKLTFRISLKLCTLCTYHFFIFVLSSWCVSVAKYLQNCHSRELNGCLYSSYRPCGNLTRFECLQYHN